MIKLDMIENKTTHTKQRTSEIKRKINHLIGHRVFLLNKPRELRKIVGIKNYISQKRDSSSNQLTAINEVLLSLEKRKIFVSRSDVDRYTYFSFPNHGVSLHEYQSGPFTVSALKALDIFDSDLSFILGASVEEHLDGKERAEKEGILEDMKMESPSSLLGLGSKVTLSRYRDLVRVTESGWRTLLWMKGIRRGDPPRAFLVPANDLRSSEHCAECPAA